LESFYSLFGEPFRNTCVTDDHWYGPFVKSKSRPVPFLWRRTRRMPLVE